MSEPYWVELPIYPISPAVMDFVSLAQVSETRSLLILKRGFCYDGPSGKIEPAVRLGLIEVGFSIDFTPDTPESMRGAAVHDGLCRLMSHGLLDRMWKDKADAIARDLWVESGMHPDQADLWFDVLQQTDFYVQSESQQQELEAP